MCGQAFMPQNQMQGGTTGPITGHSLNKFEALAAGAISDNQTAHQMMTASYRIPPDKPGACC